MTSRRGFIAQLAALVAAGTAAPAILAQVRPSSGAPFRCLDTFERSDNSTRGVGDGPWTTPWCTKNSFELKRGRRIGV